MAKVTITVKDPAKTSGVGEQFDVMVVADPPFPMREGQLDADALSSAQAAAVLCLQHLTDNARSVKSALVEGLDREGHITRMQFESEPEPEPENGGPGA